MERRPSAAGGGKLHPYSARHGEVDFYHYDFRAQALAKLVRGFDRDVQDVRAMLAHGLVERAELLSTLTAILPEIIRYPALDAAAVEAQVRQLLEKIDA